jgi:hypothetical protein
MIARVAEAPIADKRATAITDPIRVLVQIAICNHRCRYVADIGRIDIHHCVNCRKQRRQPVKNRMLPAVDFSDALSKSRHDGALFHPGEFNHLLNSLTVSGADAVENVHVNVVTN